MLGSFPLGFSNLYRRTSGTRESTLTENLQQTDGVVAVEEGDDGFCLSSLTTGAHSRITASKASTEPINRATELSTSEFNTISTSVCSSFVNLATPRGRGPTSSSGEV